MLNRTYCADYHTDQGWINMNRVLDAAHLATVWHILYFYVVTNSANPLALLEPVIWYSAFLNDPNRVC